MKLVHSESGGLAECGITLHTRPTEYHLDRQNLSRYEFGQTEHLMTAPGSVCRSSSTAVPSAKRPDLIRSLSWDLGGTKARVRFFKDLHGVRDIIWTFFKSFRIPFTAWCRKEVTAVDVNCAGDPFQWIGNRMDYRFTEGNDFFGIECLCAKLDESIFAATIEGIVFASSVDTYDCPHQMVVGIQTHERPPQNVEDRQVVRTVKGLDSGQFWFPQCLQYLGGFFCYRSCDNLFHGGMHIVFRRQRIATNLL